MKLPKFNYKKSAIIFLCIAAIYIVGSIIMVFSSEPVFEEAPQMSAEDFADTGLNFDQNYKYVEKNFKTRDGINLYANSFDIKSNTTVLLLHGILANNFQFNTTAGLLSQRTKSNIITLDFRGHGRSEGKVADISYIDQYVDDISDVVSTIKKEKPTQKIILAGHSMGGGIAMRYVLKKGVTPVDSYLLIAPALGWDSPTTRKESSESDEVFAKGHVPRIIGLAMLNAIKITAFNDKPVLFFNMQDGNPPLAYTYRSMVSMSPENVNKAFQAVNKPLLVIVGEQDEVFIADEFEPLVTKNSNGEVHIIKGANHNSVHYNPETISIIDKWLNR